MKSQFFYFFPLLTPEPDPVAAACPVNTFNDAVPVPVLAADPPFCALVIATCCFIKSPLNKIYQRLMTFKKITPIDDTPAGPAFPDPAPAAVPLPTKIFIFVNDPHFK